MKSFVILLSLFVGSLAQAQIPDLKLQSSSNFGLPALAVNNVENRVNVTLASALLNYSDKKFDFVDPIDNPMILASLFRLDSVTDIVISFEADDCVTDSVHKDIFYCRAKGNRTVTAMKTDFSGAVVEMSPVTLQTSNAYVKVHQVITIEPGFKETSFTATANLTLPKVFLNLEKSLLNPPIF